MNSHTISLCMIVKDEELVLENCLNSVQDIVDEWCILDTGSTDKTKEIIKNFSGKDPKVIPFENFVKTKNESIKQATGDYILWMDADEILKDGKEKIIEYVNSGEDVCVLNVMGGHTTYFKTRLWKNKPTVQFKGPNTHEYLDHGFKTIYDSKIVVNEHPKATKDWTHKFTRDEILIKDYLKDHPNDLRGCFYLAQSLNAQGYNKLEEAIQYYIKYLNIPGNTFTDEKIWSVYMCAQSYYNLGEPQLALKVLDIGIGLDARRAELFYYKGFIHYYLENWDEAIKYFERATKCIIPNNVIGFMEKDKYFEKPLDYLGICYYKIGDWENAHRCTVLLNTKLQDSDSRISQNLISFGRKVRSKIAMYMGWFHEPIYGGMLEERGLYGVESTYIQLAESFAKIGFEPYIFVTTTQKHNHKGVQYIPYEEFPEYVKNSAFEVILTSRHEAIFDNIEKAQKILWIQDLQTHRMGEERKYAHGQNHTIVSTNFHKDYLFKNFPHQIGKDNISVIPIAPQKEFYYNENIVKDPYNIIYSSAPDRGLEYLLNIWDKLSDAVPEISLDIFYGLESMKKVWESRGRGDYIQNYIDMVNTYSEKYENINYHSIVTKKELAEAQLRASLAVYPNIFIETFCLTAQEYQLSGTPLITNFRGALNDTVNKDINIGIIGDPRTAEIQQKYYETIIYLLNEPNQLTLKRYQRLNREKMLRDIPTWDDIATLWKERIFKNWEIK